MTPDTVITSGDWWFRRKRPKQHVNLNAPPEMPAEVSRSQINEADARTLRKQARQAKVVTFVDKSAPE